MYVINSYYHENYSQIPVSFRLLCSLTYGRPEAKARPIMNIPVVLTNNPAFALVPRLIRDAEILVGVVMHNTLLYSAPGLQRSYP